LGGNQNAVCKVKFVREEIYISIKVEARDNSAPIVPPSLPSPEKTSVCIPEWWN